MAIDFCIIGGGIAGVSVAAELSKSAKVVLLERESDLAYHTSGRSAALYSELTATSTALALSKLSFDFFRAPPNNFTEHPLYQDCSCIFTASRKDENTVEEYQQRHPQLTLLNERDINAKNPALLTGDENIVSGLLEEQAFKIDVAGLIAGYRNMFKKNGGEIITNANVIAIEQQQKQWQIVLQDKDSIRSHRLINAAGAWADDIARLAKVSPVGLTPYRRTIIVFPGPDNMEFEQWPAVGGINGHYYFLPESGKLLGSAADEVASLPCDAQPEDYDIALAAHNIETHVSFSIDSIDHKWSGLRTFTPDRQLLAGYEPEAEGFFWLAGQGGFGMQTAPAAAHAAALLAQEKPLPDEYIQAGVTASTLGRERFNH